ncbi:MAG: hypothetical protein Q4D97_00060 [Eubacteriales bacterium]|nr:hypothetical protein [Eubacteriales bacterium]
MSYFFLSLVLALLLATCLFLLLLRRLRINWAKQNRRKASFLLPSVLTLLLVAFTIFELKPRLLDTLDILQNNLHSFSASSQDLVYAGGRLQYGDRTFILSPWAPPLQTETIYRVRYAKYSGLVLGVEVQVSEENFSPNNQL